MVQTATMDGRGNGVVQIEGDGISELAADQAHAVRTHLAGAVGQEIHQTGDKNRVKLTQGE